MKTELSDPNVHPYLICMYICYLFCMYVCIGGLQRMEGNEKGIWCSVGHGKPSNRNVPKHEIPIPSE